MRRNFFGEPAQPPPRSLPVKPEPPQRQALVDPTAVQSPPRAPAVRRMGDPAVASAAAAADVSAARQEPPNPTLRRPTSRRAISHTSKARLASIARRADPEQRTTGLVTEPHPPQKFKRPLPQAGDPDYVAGQPVNEEEAQRMEQLEEDRYAYAQQAAKDAEQRRLDARSDEQEGEQYAGTPGKKQPDKEGEPLHKPGHHRGDDKDR